jgi:hypothetical protein
MSPAYGVVKAEVAVETELVAVQQLMPGGATALVRTVLAAIGPAALVDMVAAVLPRPSLCDGGAT